MTTAFNILAITLAFCALIGLTAIGLFAFLVHKFIELFNIFRLAQAEVKSTAQAMLPHVNFDGDKDQSEVKLAEGWDEKNDLRD